MTLVIDVTCRGNSYSRRLILEDGDQMEIGRANEELNLTPDPQLSRRHFVLKYSNRQIEVTHLSRTNPTLIADEGSADFQPVNGRQVASGGCRIIAGSHRFVAVIEAPDSVISPTLSGDENAQIWSDVDEEDSVAQPFDDSFCDPTPASKPDPHRAAQSDSSGAAFFNLDDSVEEQFGASTKADDATPSRWESRPTEPAAEHRSQAEPEPENDSSPLPASNRAEPKPQEKSEPNKKIVFPLDDDFFD